MQRQAKILRTNDKGAALIIVLAFVVLFTGLSIAYFSRTTADRQVAHSSFNQTRADQLGLSAADLIISDFKQEIINGSTTAKDYSAATMYIPTSSVNVVPQTSGKPPLVAGVDPIPNLIRRSVYPETAVAPFERKFDLGVMEWPHY
jgi:Tfp pilus assembly protein PilX